MTRFFKVVFIAFMAFFSVVVYQGYQYMETLDTTRLSALNKWAEDDAQKTEQVQAFVANCTGSTVVDMRTRTGAPRPLVSIYECASRFGSDELSKILVQTDDDVHAPIPLRWL